LTPISDILCTMTLVFILGLSLMKFPTKSLRATLFTAGSSMFDGKKHQVFRIHSADIREDKDILHIVIDRRSLEINA